MLQQNDLTVLGKLPLTNYHVINLMVQLTPNTWETKCCKVANISKSFLVLFTCLSRKISYFESNQRQENWNYETLINSCSVYKYYARLIIWKKKHCSNVELSPTSGLTDPTRTYSLKLHKCYCNKPKTKRCINVSTVQTNLNAATAPITCFLLIYQ